MDIFVELDDRTGVVMICAARASRASADPHISSMAPLRSHFLRICHLLCAGLGRT
jgi:hypothetical protein